MPKTEPSVEALLNEMGPVKVHSRQCRTCFEFTAVQRAFVEEASRRGHSAARIVAKLFNSFSIRVGESSIKNHMRYHVVKQ